MFYLYGYIYILKAFKTPQNVRLPRSERYPPLNNKQAKNNLQRRVGEGKGKLTSDGKATAAVAELGGSCGGRRGSCPRR